MKPMHWVRLWVEPHLDNGTFWRKVTLEERGLFYSLLVLAGRCNAGGIIHVADGIPYTDDQLTGLLKTDKATFLRCVLTLEREQMVARNLHGCLEIVNWHNYQTEYERQKGYRGKLQRKVTGKGYTPEEEVRSQKKKQKKNQNKDCASDDAPPPVESAPKPKPKRPLNAQAQAVGDCLKAYLQGREDIGQPHPGEPDPGPVIKWLGRCKVGNGAVALFREAVRIAVLAHPLSPRWHGYPMTIGKFIQRLPELNGAYLDAARAESRKRKPADDPLVAEAVDCARRNSGCVNGKAPACVHCPNVAEFKRGRVTTDSTRGRGEKGGGLQGIGKAAV